MPESKSKLYNILYHPAFANPDGLKCHSKNLEDVDLLDHHKNYMAVLMNQCRVLNQEVVCLTSLANTLPPDRASNLLLKIQALKTITDQLAEICESEMLGRASPDE